MIYQWREIFGEHGLYCNGGDGYQRPVARAVRATSARDRELLAAAPGMERALRRIMELLEDGKMDAAHTVAIRALVDAGSEV